MAATTHIHWLWRAYRMKEPQGGAMYDSTNIDVVAKTLDDSRSRVETLVPLSLKGTEDSGAGYYLASVTERPGAACACPIQGG